MSKQSDYMRGRNEGMDFALRIALEKGIDELRKEVEFRGISGCGVNISRKDIEEAGRGMAENATFTAIAVSFEIMRTHFNFPPSQMDKFIREFNRIVEECIDNPELLKDYKIKAEGYGIKFN